MLNMTKTKTDIVADSGLQLYIKSWPLGLALTNLDSSKYHAFAGEGGAHLDHRSNLVLDFTVFEKTILPSNKITTKYIEVAPKVVIEVDVKVELEDPQANIFDEFILRNVRKLHQF